jgi:type I restriction enzyme M protein
MLDAVTNKRIADCFDILLGKVPDPKSRIEKITIALVYKFRGALARSIVCTGSTT